VVDLPCACGLQGGGSSSAAAAWGAGSAVDEVGLVVLQGSKRGVEAGTVDVLVDGAIDVAQLELLGCAHVEHPHLAAGDEVGCGAGGDVDDFEGRLLGFSALPGAGEVRRQGDGRCQEENRYDRFADHALRMKRHERRVNANREPFSCDHASSGCLQSVAAFSSPTRRDDRERDRADRTRTLTCADGSARKSRARHPP